MDNEDILLIKNHEVLALLDGREADVLDAVRAAYMLHARGQSSLPHSLFLRFPENPRNRIIALPAALGGDFDVAGMKWIASFPGNLELGIERASAVIILNSSRTGQPFSLIEGSAISARRTGASAAAAALALQGPRPYDGAALVGCGPINFEVLRFLLVACPSVRRLTLFDLSPERAEAFGAECGRAFPGLAVSAAADADEALASAPLVSLATTASVPHISDLSACPRGATVLHVSLRDLAPEVVLAHDNVVDDADHVCRAETSLHLAELASGGRDFIRCSLADVLLGEAPARRDPDGLTIFSPFGLGVLDMALAKLVYDLAVRQQVGTVIESFLPAPRRASQQHA
jgi:ornithine cyclodeaminase